MGESGTVLENVKSYNSRALIQVVVGVVTKVNEKSEFRVGDQVLAFVQSKFVKTNVQVSLHSVLKIPAQNSSDIAAVLSGNLLDIFQYEF